MRLRKARQHEIDALERLDIALFGEEVRMRPRVGDSYWLVADGDGEVVGYAGCRLVQGGELCFLHRAGVLRQARGRGLQRRLIRARLRWAKRQGCSQAITYTVAGNIASANNLIRCGFELYWPEYAWVGREDILYWWRKL